MFENRVANTKIYIDVLAQHLSIDSTDVKLNKKRNLQYQNATFLLSQSKSYWELLCRFCFIKKY